MFWEFLEAAIKSMTVFRELNFDPVKEILKIRCHIYILMKKVMQQNTCENEVFRSTMERN